MRRGSDAPGRRAPAGTPRLVAAEQVDDDHDRIPDVHQYRQAHA